MAFSMDQKKQLKNFYFEAGLELKEFRSFLNELISTDTNFLSASGRFRFTLYAVKSITYCEQR